MAIALKLSRQRRSPRFFDEPTARVKLLPGTWRSCTPEQTWGRFSRLQKRLGITRIADITGLDTIGIPVVSAIRPRGLSLSTQQGKGVTLVGAMVSALMESIETWHAEHLELPQKVAAWNWWQKQSRTKTGFQAAVPQQLPMGPALFRPRQPIPWVQGMELNTRKPIWVPQQCVTLNCVFESRVPMFDVSSNGLASGNSMSEAAVHGLCEVIERDAESQWRRSGEDRRLVLETVVNPVCREILRKLERAGVRVWAWLLSSAADVPVVAVAISEDPHKPSLRQLGVYQGFGCHLSAEVALSRALTEAVQTRLTYISGARDDFFPIDYQRATNRVSVKRFWRRYSAPAHELVDCGKHSDFARMPKCATFSQVLSTLLSRLQQAGIDQVIAVDLRRRGIGVPVVKILVPGLACDTEVQG
jgi:YcaO-like protein with predicted kinase domain